MIKWCTNKIKSEDTLCYSITYLYFLNYSINLFTSNFNPPILVKFVKLYLLLIEPFGQNHNRQI